MPHPMVPSFSKPAFLTCGKYTFNFKKPLHAYQEAYFKFLWAFPACREMPFQFQYLLRTTSEVAFRFQNLLWTTSEVAFRFQNLLWTTSKVAFRFPKPISDHLRSGFPISKPTLDHLRSGFPISKTHFGPPPKWLSDFQNLLWTTSEVTFQFQKLLRVICINSIFYTFELINFILLRSWNP